MGKILKFETMLKRRYNIIAVAGVALLAASCSDDDHVLYSDPNEFALNPVAIVADANGGTYDLVVTGSGEWTASMGETNTETAGWCVLSQVTGKGQTTVKIEVTPSGSFTKRRSMIMEFTSGGRKLKCRLVQGTQVLGDNEVLINGNVWSTVNVDEPGTFCQSPDEIGKLYQFNRNKPWAFEDNPEGWSSAYANDGVNWQAENDPSPEGWRVPTAQEMAALWEIGATWVSPDKSGFNRAGLIVGVDAATADLVTKDNCRALGAMFLPQSGWLNSDGVLDRTWLVAVRTSTSLSDTHGGMSLGDSGGYRDVWGWGDGQKERAAMIRPVKILEVED